MLHNWQSATPILSPSPLIGPSVFRSNKISFSSRPLENIVTIVIMVSTSKVKDETGVVSITLESYVNEACFNVAFKVHFGWTTADGLFKYCFT